MVSMSMVNSRIHVSVGAIGFIFVGLLFLWVIGDVDVKRLESVSDSVGCLALQQSAVPAGPRRKVFAR